MAAPPAAAQQEPLLSDTSSSSAKRQTTTTTTMTTTALHPRQQHQHQQQHASFSAGILSAAIGGVTHALIEQPLTTPIGAAITQTQVNGRHFFHNLADLFRRRAMYRGLPAALLGAVPKSVVHYTLLTSFLHLIVGDGDPLKSSTSQGILVGMLTGVTEVAFTTPLNFVKFRMMRPEWGYVSTWDCVRTVYRSEGVLAFWKGTGAIAIRNPLCMATAWACFLHADARLPSDLIGRHAIAGGIGGVLGSFVSYPFEMLRAARQHNLNFREEILRPGPRRLIAGWFPGACHLTFTSALMGVIIPRTHALAEYIQDRKIRAAATTAETTAATTAAEKQQQQQQQQHTVQSVEGGAK